MHEEIHTFIYWHICLNRQCFLESLQSPVDYVLEGYFIKRIIAAISEVKCGLEQ